MIAMRPLDRLIASLRREKLLLTNASLLAAGTGVTSILGFAFWWVAARSAPAATVGTAAATISLMIFIAQLGELGLGALLMGEGRRLDERAGEILSAAQIASFVCAASFAAAYSFIADVAAITPTVPGGAFIFGAALISLTLVTDNALFGLRQGRLPVMRNVVSSVVRLALLSAMIFSPLRILSSSFVDIWVASLILSLALMAFAGRDRLALMIGRPNFAWLRPRLVQTLGHHSLNMANIAPTLLLPVVVAGVLTPSVNAAFYVAWTLMNVAFLAPGSFAAIVFAVGAEHPAELAARLKTALGLSAIASIGCAAVCGFGARPMLTFFSPGYADVAASSLALLGFSVAPVTVKCHYMAVQRIAGRMMNASILLALGCLLELAGAGWGGLRGGLFGLSAGWLAAVCVEACLMAPALLRALAPTEADRFAPIPHEAIVIAERRP